jgi:1-acyl-sn-glycerol-3-phosphate acyltransferase
MLAAQKSKWFEILFALYNRNLFARRFHDLRVAGLENLLNRDRQIPLVLYANHSSWWDGLLAFEIGRKAALDHFLMMEERQLKKLFLFRRLGAFSVIRENGREAVKSVRYAIELLKEKQNRAVWIFPQGEILPNDTRPLKFYNGLARILEQTGSCFAVPVAMRYEFLDNFNPAAFARIGKLELFDGKVERKLRGNHFAETLTATLNELKTDILDGNFHEYKKIA